MIQCAGADSESMSQDIYVASSKWRLQAMQLCSKLIYVLISEIANGVDRLEVGKLIP